MDRLYALADGNRWPVAIRENLAANLKQLLKDKDLSQSEVAKKAKVSQGLISGLVNGEYWAGDDTVDRLAEALGVDAAELFQNPDKLVRLNQERKLAHRLETIEQKVDLLIKKSLINRN
jgi:transcriptional regulator with XRE-family HTH domain